MEIRNLNFFRENSISKWVFANFSQKTWLRTARKLHRRTLSRSNKLRLSKILGITILVKEILSRAENFAGVSTSFDVFKIYFFLYWSY